MSSKQFPKFSFKYLSTSKIFERGKKYQHQGRVTNIKFKKSNKFIIAKAIVEGSDDYNTQIKWDAQTGELRTYKCDCPYDWGDMCKHVVALMLEIERGSKKGLANMLYLQDNQKYQKEDLDLYFKNYENGIFNFLLYDKKNDKYLSYIPESWIETQEQNNKNFLEYLNIKLSNKDELLCFQDEYHIKILYLFKKTNFIKDFSTKKEIIFSKEKPNIQLEYKFDLNNYAFHLMLKEGCFIKKNKREYFFYLNGVFYEMPPIKKEYLKLGMESLFEEFENFHKKGFLFNYFFDFTNNFHEKLEEWAKCKIKLPDWGSIIKEKKPELHVYIKKEKRYYREEILISFFYKFEDKSCSVIPLFQDVINDDFGYSINYFNEYDESIDFRNQLKINNKNFILLNKNQLEYTIKKQKEEVAEKNIEDFFKKKDEINNINNTKILINFEQFKENVVLIERDFFTDQKIIELLKKIQKNAEIEEDIIAIDFDLKQRGLKTFGNNLHKFAKQFDWHLHFSKNLKSLRFKRTKVNFDFDISMSNNNLLEFNLDIHLKKHKLTEKKLLELIKEKEIIKIEDEYIEISNHKEIEKILNFKNKHKKNKKGKLEAPLWEMSEIENLIEQSPSFKAKRNERYESFVKEAKKGKPIEKIILPTNLNKILRSYQKNGVNWMFFLRKYAFGGILADDMGLGKTLQTLAFIETLMKKKFSKTKPFLIICPKTLLFNWESEIQKFTPKLKYLLIHGTLAERKKALKKTNLKKYQIIITSYSLIKQDLNLWLKSNIDFDTIFIDEAQHIKNHKTKTSKAIKVIPANYKIALSGTPLENGVSEIWSIFDFLMRGFLHNYDNFRTNFENPIVKHGNNKLLKDLAQKTKPFLLRRTKKEILKELPDKIEQISNCELSKDQLTLYTKILEEVKGNVFSNVEKKGFEKSRIIILAALTKLRQICNHPSQIEPKMAKAHSGKIDTCMELLHDAFEGDHKVLIFSSFVKTLQILKERFLQEKIDFSYLDGQTRDRKTEIKTFTEKKDKKVFLISLKAGGTGLNLTAADTVILFDPWWNPMVEMQAMDRTHRIGQKNVVNVYSLITKNTIEEKMLKIKERKKKLFDSVVGQTDSFIKKLTWNDLKELFD